MNDTTVDISGTIFDCMKLCENACFLCGTLLNDNDTSEHVFPKWLLRRHNLWNQGLTLLNGTSIRYSQLLIPCCLQCNTTYLSILENRIRCAVDHGYTETVKLPSLIVFQWIGKIFYGILRKEMTLLLDRRKSDGGTIIPPELLEGFSSLHLFLQSIRQPFIFHEIEPFSVLTLNLHHNDSQDDFHFRDSVQGMICSLRTRDVGFIVALQDFGIIPNTYGHYVNSVNGRKLLYIQQDELYAKCLYQMTLITRTPKYVISSNTGNANTCTVHMLPIGGLSSKPIVNEWVQSDYAEILEGILRLSNHDVDFDQLFSPPDLVATWMNDPLGNLTLVNAEGNRIQT